MIHAGKIREYGLILLGLILACYIGTEISSSEANPINTAFQTLSWGIYFIAFLSPRAGLILLLFLCGYSDFFKRIMVMFGSVNIYDVKDILSIAPITCAVLFFREGVSFLLKRQHYTWHHLLIFFLIVIVNLVVLLQNYRDTKMIYIAIITSANSGIYLTLLLTAAITLQNFQGVQQLLRTLVLLFIPVALYGISQGIFGLSQFEIDYLRTGLTSMIKELYDVLPRPFSTLNSSHALSIVTASLCVISGYYLSESARHREIPVTFFWLGMTLLYAVACVYTFNRSAWFLLISSLCLSWAFQTRLRTISFYVSFLILFSLLIVNANWILSHLGDIQKLLPLGGGRLDQTFRVGTYSDRLQGYINVMHNPHLWTPFGRGLRSLDVGNREEMVHDSLTWLLVSFGYISLVIVLIILAIFLFISHREVFRTPIGSTRRLTVQILAVIVGIIINSFLFGSHFHVFPINALFWLFVSCLLCLIYFPNQELPLPNSSKMNSSPPDSNP